MLKSRIPSAVFAFSLAVLALPCHADIYKYVDSNGNTTFTDRYRPGAIKIADTSDDSRAKSRRNKHHDRNASSYTPANFPRVSAATQRKRDDVRRMLLQEERSKEEKSLAAAQAAATKAAPGERGRLAENVRLHQKNIELLDAELSRIK